MWRKRREQQIARVFDGEAADSKTAGPPGELHDSLTLIREGARAARRRAEIADAQFPAFLNGIHARIAEEPSRATAFGRSFSRDRLWAVVSLTSAALIVALSAILVFSGETPDVRATTVVEEVSTDIDGASVHWDTSDDGATVVWVEFAERDLL